MSAAPDYMIQHDGWWWPKSDTACRPVTMESVDGAVRAVLDLTTGREVIVQAGGNVGVYPLALADHFRRVLTFEPEHENFNCLVRNLEARDSLKRITAMFSALGETPGQCSPVYVEPGNAGAHRVRFDSGIVPVWRVDDIPLKACDCIWLDIEGAELLALKGARQTIELFKPVVVAEDKGLGQAFGHSQAELHTFMSGLGYRPERRIGRDTVFLPEQRS